VIGKHGASSVLMQPAPNGTGIIAGGAMRAVFEVMGVTDIIASRSVRPIRTTSFV
jgi:small subunit ribosomal protein S5